MYGENIWGGLPCKQHFNAFDEAYHQLILDFLDTTTTISPIWKDVKWQCIKVKTWEVHPTHYLQETQIYNNLVLFCSMELHFLGSFLLGRCNSFFVQFLDFNVKIMQSRNDGNSCIGLKSWCLFWIWSTHLSNTYAFTWG